MNRIASFSVDHDRIVPGVYLSRVDGDIVTYDLRTRTPNVGEYMDHATMHSVEHMLATFLRNSSVAEHVVYFGPMGCQTGFYLLMRGASHAATLRALAGALEQTLRYEGAVFGASRKECGHYENLSLDAAKAECRAYLRVVRPLARDDVSEVDLRYPGEAGRS